MRALRSVGVSARAFACLLVLASCGAAEEPPAPRLEEDAAGASALAVSELYIGLPAVAGRPAALYGTIAGAAADRLVGVEIAGVRTALHESVEEGGVARMLPRESFPVPAAGDLRLAPGGKHVMLFGLPALGPGASVPVQLRFESGAVVDASAVTRAPGTSKEMSHSAHR